MVQEFRNAGLGNISVNNEVIKNIALKAAADISGAHGPKSGRINAIWNKLIRRTSARGVKLEFQSASEVRITLKLFIEYGMSIPRVAEEVQRNVKDVTEHMTGLNVTEVAVDVMGMIEVREQKTEDRSQKTE
ncbi:MAG: Asp23/Gls24 family envelope stress response protein [Candidatus Omnitrophota bacterium]|nr:Asp23/Gls24 family envelope stress response protein [Candidatus Omnitrophota bacterium]